MAEKAQLQHAWEKIDKKIQELVPFISYMTSIKDLQPVDIFNRKIVLKANSEMVASTVMDNHADKLQEAIIKSNLGDSIVGFLLVVDGSTVFTLDSQEDAFSSFQSSPIRKEFTFDSFVAGNGNKFVYEAAKAVAENPGNVFNPLFIYGESGLGKTHLMHAIANQINETYPEKRVLYTTCENFLNEFIDSLSQKNSARFRMHYRGVDVLMIDDVQFLKDKKSTQEELFHTFNELSSQNKQIVLTSDKHPREIATLEERLRTRFEGGMIVDVQPPDLETKIAILKRKALDRKCPISDNEVLEFLAQVTDHNVRTLEGHLTKVIFASKLHEEPITLDLAKRALNQSVRETEEKEEITPDKIIDAVCGYYKQRRDDVLGKGKKAEVALARQVCAYLMCELLTLPLISIGKLLGRDHTTIMYARDKIEQLLKLNAKLAKEVDDIKNIVWKE
ncbi:MAG: chromosomal replication initiator protein DnaA [Clostridia bacterium]|nr:chromosomal replication initiator protein DnaA [Clostridia bacterium]